MTVQPDLGVGAIDGVSLLCAVVYFAAGIRMRRCAPQAASARFGVASLALVIAALVYMRVLAPVVGYAALGLVMVCLFAFDQFCEEQSGGQRIASLTPRRTVDPCSLAWIAISLASVLWLLPYVMLDEDRIAAVFVGVCSLTMSAIAWRVASAPIKLRADDVQGQRLRDRVVRYRKTGVGATVAIGVVFVFMSFVNAGLPVVLPEQHLAVGISMLSWTGIWVWRALLCNGITRHSRSAS